MKHKTDAELAQRTKVLLGRLAKEPKAPSIIGIAEVLFLQGKFKEVITRLRAVADVYEDHSYRYHMILGRTYAATGDLVRARRHFEHALSIAPQCEFAPSELIKVETSKSSENLVLPVENTDLFIDEKPLLPKEPEHRPEPKLFEKSIDFGYERESKQQDSQQPLSEKAGLNLNKAKISDALSNLTGRIDASGLPKAKSDANPLEQPVQKSEPKRDGGFVSAESNYSPSAPATKTEKIEIPQHLRDALVGFSDDEIREFLKMDPSMANKAKPQTEVRKAEFPLSTYEPEEEEKNVSFPKGNFLDLQKVAAALPNISKNWKTTLARTQNAVSEEKPKMKDFEPAAQKQIFEERLPSSESARLSKTPDKAGRKSPEELQAEAMRLLEAELGASLDPMADFVAPQNVEKVSAQSPSISEPPAAQQDSINSITKELLEKEFGTSFDPLADFEKPLYAQDIPLPTSPTVNFDTSKLMDALKNLTPPQIPVPELRNDFENFIDQQKLNQSLAGISLPNIPVPEIPKTPNESGTAEPNQPLEGLNANSLSNLPGINFDELSKSLSKISFPSSTPPPEANALDLDKLAQSLSSIKLPPVYETGNPTPIEEQRKPFDDGDEIKTPTRSLAEIFTQQGALTKAIKVYEALQELEPEKRGEYGIMITGLKAQLMLRKSSD